MENYYYRIQVSQIKELNDRQIEVIISGLNSLSNDTIREIIEISFKIIQNGDCKRCPIAPPSEYKCICHFQNRI